MRISETGKTDLRSRNRVRISRLHKSGKLRRSISAVFLSQLSLRVSCSLSLVLLALIATRTRDHPPLGSFSRNDLHISACVWPIIMFHPVFDEWLHYRDRGIVELTFRYYELWKINHPRASRSYARVSLPHNANRLRVHIRTRTHSDTWNPFVWFNAHERGPGGTNVTFHRSGACTSHWSLFCWLRRVPIRRISPVFPPA